MAAMMSRKAADTEVPITPPMAWKSSSSSLKVAAVAATAMVASTTTVEWPSEKNRPAATGRLPSCMSLRVTLSMAAMWSASTAWRSPKL